MTPRTFDQSSKLKNVLYEIRGNALVEAARLEAAGHSVLKLNTGNPAIFGFEAPQQIVRDMLATLPTAHGYSESKGIISARRAVVSRYEQVEGFPLVDPEDVYLGNGVSELITMTMQALLDEGDEVLIPAPDYPLWTAMTSLAGGTPVHYLCDEENGWNPDLEDLRSKVTPRTKAIVVINPNNPTGAVYSREVLQGIVQVARENDLLLLSDEIYDRILFDDAQHIPTATLAPDLLCLTFNGLSKTYRVAGYRSGWLVITGPQQHAKGFIEGITLLASTRLCPNVPAQHAVQAALGGVQSIEALIAPSGRLHLQRDAAWEGLSAIPGVSCVKPAGALYAFPRLDPEVHEIHDDAKLIYDLLVAERILLVQGTGFNWPTPDHLRVVTLPEPRVITEAIERLGNFLASYRQ
ncbi:pyridoxal phosphate-dependent aminotransferase [Microbacterium azadirachtae]|uniref:alanine transaminase n=1 Tax=Microbacterium azadirachtae TaxID=582680 RepID=A0A0F0L285_9MICO|nr:pyridoxal phosphate-dependent aminotransferase [Microbacterium azadirachtae]KJL27247.1 Glutamate-pyruvate aminotransferase AlaA [Microbacterium azadirachtae]SDM49932.1 alanine-synthesizing transaminase [Microbacterium azadirachtae]SEG59003.1 alanine-synthesizing transaminase [Microbacterium azadirachtae]SEG62628.1 alanine-synthesizing transaminase [Microbacterium azadirachtae]SFR41821.1 alanine-synthesizing transaminase [Microbacterium azadirachtae]